MGGHFLRKYKILIACIMMIFFCYSTVLVNAIDLFSIPVGNGKLCIERVHASASITTHTYEYFVRESDGSLGIVDDIYSYYDAVNLNRLYLTGKSGFTVIDYSNFITIETYDDLESFDIDDKLIFQSSAFKYLSDNELLPDRSINRIAYLSIVISLVGFFAILIVFSICMYKRVCK
jgi:hypothetical protein